MSGTSIGETNIMDLFVLLQEDSAMIKVGLMDLETCHSKFNSEPSLELKSLILSLVSALFVFLFLAKKRGEFSEAHHRMMVSICDSMFKCFHYEDSGTGNTREIRRHSSALLIKVRKHNYDT